MAKHIEPTCLVCARSLDQDAENGFILSTTLRNDKEFSKAFAKSDIPQIIARIAENAIHHISTLRTNSRAKPRQKCIQLRPIRSIFIGIRCKRKDQDDDSGQT